MNSISVVINTKNAAATLETTLESVKWANEIIIMDMASSDQTLDIAKKYTPKIFSTPDVGFVEPARAAAIAKAKNQWILILDADEEVSPQLARLLQQKAKGTPLVYKIPRRNIIFGKWIEHTGWWPDYQLRFFPSPLVEWPQEIHASPIPKGPQVDLEAVPQNALIHHHYQTVEQFIDRLNVYTTIQAASWHKNGKSASVIMLIKETVDEFLRRFFLFEGFKDGAHGLILSLLQSFSQMITVIKLWQLQGFTELDLDKAQDQITTSFKDLRYWITTKKINEVKPQLYKTVLKIKRRFRL